MGTPAYTERGFVYATTHNPTTRDNKEIASGSGTGTFSVNATGIAMLSSENYYVRAYATSSKGTVYGEEKTFSFSGTQPQPWEVSFENINRSAGTATFIAGISRVGVPAYSERGFVYSTSQNPSVSDTKVLVPGSDTGTFSADISGLVLGETYYVRAFATNIIDTNYSYQTVLDFKPQPPIFNKVQA